jgi:hypothetical protein
MVQPRHPAGFRRSAPLEEEQLGLRVRDEEKDRRGGPAGEGGASARVHGAATGAASEDGGDLARATSPPSWSHVRGPRPSPRHRHAGERECGGFHAPR